MNGTDDFIKIKSSPTLKNLINKSFRIEVLVKPDSRNDTKPFMIGDLDRKYLDYCVVGRPGYNMGLFWNNSKNQSQNALKTCFICEKPGKSDPRRRKLFPISSVVG